MDNALLYSKLASLPENLKSEVADFIEFLLNKAKKNKPEKNKPKPVFGSGKGMFKINPGFNEPLDDHKDYMS
jgi:hypothetical protein